MKAVGLLSRELPGRARLSILTIVLLIPCTLFCRTSETDRALGFDYLTFKGEKTGRTLVEMYFQVPVYDLQFVKDEVGFVARYKIDLHFENADSKEAHSLTYRDEVKIQTLGEKNDLGAHLIRIPLALPPGLYHAVVKFVDLETDRETILEQTFVASDYGGTELKISDLELAASIVPTNDRSGMVKKHLRIVPDLAKTLTSSRDTLYIYCELYNLEPTHAAEANLFHARFTVYSRSGQEMKTLEFDYDKPGDTCTLTVGIPLAELRSGEYILECEVKDLDADRTSLRRTSFRVRRNANWLTDVEFSKLIKKLSFVATPKELQKLRSLPVGNRAQALTEFWAKRDPFPDTRQNELRNTFLSRIDYANHKFVNSHGEGWESDQGQIYVRYGEPTYIDRYKTDLGLKTVEVWEYDKLDRKFYFLDEHGFGEFRLLNPMDSQDFKFSF